MSTSGIVMAVIAISITWGGFGYCLYIAMNTKDKA